jgi:hypothetical protein
VFLSECCKSKSWRCMHMHVASICFKSFQVFHTYVCECFIWMLDMFTMVFKYFSGIFTSVSFMFFCILQLLYLDISKVDRVHIECVWEAAVGTNDVGGDVGDVQSGAGPLLVCSLVRPTCYVLVCSLCAATSGC